MQSSWATTNGMINFAGGRPHTATVADSDTPAHVELSSVAAAVGGRSVGQGQELCDLPPRHVPPMEAALTEQSAAVAEWLASNFSSFELSPASMWLVAWYERLEGWWLATPYQSQLQSCLPALGLHLAARFDHTLRQWAQRAGLHARVSTDVEPSAASTSDCEWLRMRLGFVAEAPHRQIRI